MCSSLSSECSSLNILVALSLTALRSLVECHSFICIPLSLQCAFLWNISEVQFSRSVMSDPMNHSIPGLPVHHQLLEFTQIMSIESVMPSNHLILCRPLLLLPSIFPSIRVFSNESALHIRWPKYWNFSFSISPSNEHPGLISFRMDLDDRFFYV